MIIVAYVIEVIVRTAADIYIFDLNVLFNIGFEMLLNLEISTPFSIVAILCFSPINAFNVSVAFFEIETNVWYLL